MTPLPRARCPVCGGDVALRRGGQLREHRDVRHPMWSVPGAVREGQVPLCDASGLTTVDATALAEEQVR